MKITLYKYFRKKGTDQYDSIELQYSFWHFISGNPRWFCRVWRKDWLKKIQYKSFGEAYGKNKFEAMRKALSEQRPKNTSEPYHV